MTNKLKLVQKAIYQLKIKYILKQLHKLLAKSKL